MFSRPARLLGVLLALLFALAGLFGLGLQAAGAEIVPLEQNWSYRWGDSPFGPNETPLWTQTTEDDAWIAIDFPSNPPGRGGRENIWYRVTLPPLDWRDPALFIFSVDTIVEVYLDGQPLYRFGTFSAEGKGEFAGWPWHMIPLPQDAGGKLLYFRVFSDYIDIGLWGELLLGERIALLQRVLTQSVERLITSSFSLLIAILALIFAPLERDRRGFGAIALFAFASGGMLLSGAQAALLIFNHPLLWEFIGAGGYYLIPVAIALLLEQWLRPDRSWLLVVIRRLHLAYLFGALALAGLGWVSVANTYPVFDALFAITLPIMMLPALPLVRAGTLEQKLILAAVALLGLLLMLDMAVAHNLLPWTQVPLAWGVLSFSLAIVVISVRHFASTQRELAVLNTSLETQVATRTAELERLVEREAARVCLLEMENRKGAQLEVLIARLQNCERLCATEQVLNDSLPGLCEPLPGAFYRVGAAGEGRAPRVTWGDPPPTLDESLAAPVPRSGSGEETDRSTDTTASSRIWPFRLHYEHPQFGRTDFGLLLLRAPAGEASDQTSSKAGGELPEETLLWWRFLERAVEKINLSLSLLALQDELRVLSYEDGLTGLKNRRFLDEILSREIAVAERQRTPLSLVICDVDHFKRFNDSHGHAAGDAALKQVAGQLRRVFRETDLVCRYGGEEFVALMPAAGIDSARERSEALRSLVAAEPIQVEGLMLGPVTLSAGIASYPEPVADPNTLMMRADEALYRAKQAGRDQVELAV
ncbi:sensor domain-containing diguanylate cyclase [Thiorhodovibrio frisius]|uniref:diguanylate cyclase n=1 Tax=Thiorhodovibrio frisius TaxID=631362 RepID=H8YZJ8_9GAMM|nr:GGDEF domain-containing protein [Thiorhodovibrio frisius]EIC22125.1 diguanylate cyclase (GGDEF) domain-containing protein [Thiorhodovibrio frisius]WPL24418.1 Bacteriophytochrome cph2 [Thiorhodovibrio frisius]